MSITTNTTGIHPCAGYILAEYVEVDQNGHGKIPKNIRDKMTPTEDTHHVVVVEDGREYGQKLKCGARIITTRLEPKSVSGRNFVILKPEEIIAYFDQT